MDDDPNAPWAKDVLDGAFGQRAPKAVQELEEASAADVIFAKVQEARSTAFGLAYEKFVRFKNVVRQAYGPSSLEYRRIHVRSNGQLAVPDEPGAPVEPGQP